MVEPLKTADGRYIVVRGRLWRTADPDLSPERRAVLVSNLMAARRAVRDALAKEDATALRAARDAVQSAKVSLGERGPVWWSDNAPDQTRRMAVNTDYRDWFLSQTDSEGLQP